MYRSITGPTTREAMNNQSEHSVYGQAEIKKIIDELRRQGCTHSDFKIEREAAAMYRHHGSFSAWMARTHG